MKQVRFIWIILLLVLLGCVILWFLYIQQQKGVDAVVQEYSSINAIGSKQDEQFIPIDEVVQDESQNIQQEIEAISWLNIQLDASSQSDFLIAQLEASQDTGLITPLIKQLITASRYEEALSYLAYAHDRKIVLDLDQFAVISTMLNAFDLNFKNLDSVKLYVEQQFLAQTITKDQSLLFFALITLVRWNTDDYRFFIDQLSDEYSTRKTLYQSALEQYQQFPGAADYYLRALLWTHALQQWYPNIAKTIGQAILGQDDKYMLARQLVAYAAMQLGTFDEAITHLQRLISHDLIQPDQYHFLLGVAYYQTSQYSNMIFALQQVKSEVYATQRSLYMMLAYLTLWDMKKYSEQVDTLSTTALSKEQYLWLFYHLLRENDRVTQLDITNESIRHSIAWLLRQCYQWLSDDDALVCLYGKAWLMLALGQVSQAYDALRRVVQWFPQDYLYLHLARLATELGNPLAAKKYYLRSGKTPQTNQWLGW